MNQKIKFGIYYTEELEGTEEMKEAPKPEVAEETPAKPFTMPDAEQLDFRAVLKSKVWVWVS